MKESRPNNKQDKTFTVNVPTGLLEFLRESLPGKSRTTVKSYLSHRQVLVGKKPVTRFDYALKPGEVVIIRLGGRKEQDHYQGLSILYEDKQLVVISKDSGLLSIATEKEKAITAYNILSFHVKKANPANRIFVIHRLDKDASGVMVFAKSEEVQQQMQKEWQEAVTERVYSVLVEGEPDQKEGTVTSWLKENKALVMYSSPEPGDGLKAVTHYRLVRTNGLFSLLDVELETGRKNQIRVHMKDLGHPIAGDKKYGSKQDPLGRLALHARLLGFRHPVLQTEMTFEAPVPKKFASLAAKSASEKK